jgi:hypothetical protein
MAKHANRAHGGIWGSFLMEKECFLELSNCDIRSSIVIDWI